MKVLILSIGILYMCIGYGHSNHLSENSTISRDEFQRNLNRIRNPANNNRIQNVNSLNGNLPGGRNSANINRVILTPVQDGAVRSLRTLLSNRRGRANPRLIGFLIPRPDGRTQLRLMRGAMRFFTPNGRRRRTRGNNAERNGSSLPFNLRTIIDAARRANLLPRNGTTAQRNGNPPIVVLRSSQRNRGLRQSLNSVRGNGQIDESSLGDINRGIRMSSSGRGNPPENENSRRSVNLNININSPEENSFGGAEPNRFSGGGDGMNQPRFGGIGRPRPRVPIRTNLFQGRDIDRVNTNLMRQLNSFQRRNSNNINNDFADRQPDFGRVDNDLQGGFSTISNINQFGASNINSPSGIQSGSSDLGSDAASLTGQPPPLRRFDQQERFRSVNPVSRGNFRPRSSIQSDNSGGFGTSVGGSSRFAGTISRTRNTATSNGDRSGSILNEANINSANNNDVNQINSFNPVQSENNIRSLNSIRSFNSPNTINSQDSNSILSLNPRSQQDISDPIGQSSSQNNIQPISNRNNIQNNFISNTNSRSGGNIQNLNTINNFNQFPTQTFRPQSSINTQNTLFGAQGQLIPNSNQIQSTSQTSSSSNGNLNMQIPTQRSTQPVRQVNRSIDFPTFMQPTTLQNVQFAQENSQTTSGSNHFRGSDPFQSTQIIGNGNAIQGNQQVNMASTSTVRQPRNQKTQSVLQQFQARNNAFNFNNPAMIQPIVDPSLFRIHQHIDQNTPTGTQTQNLNVVVPSQQTSTNSQFQSGNQQLNFQNQNQEMLAENILVGAMSGIPRRTFSNMNIAGGQIGNEGNIHNNQPQNQDLMNFRQNIATMANGKSGSHQDGMNSLTGQQSPQIQGMQGMLNELNANFVRDKSILQSITRNRTIRNGMNKEKSASMNQSLGISPDQLKSAVNKLNQLMALNNEGMGINLNQIRPSIRERESSLNRNKMESAIARINDMNISKSNDASKVNIKNALSNAEFGTDIVNNNNANMNISRRGGRDGVFHLNSNNNDIKTGNLDLSMDLRNLGLGENALNLNLNQFSADIKNGASTMKQNKIDPLMEKGLDLKTNQALPQLTNEELLLNAMSSQKNEALLEQLIADIDRSPFKSLNQSINRRNFLTSRQEGGIDKKMIQQILPVPPPMLKLDRLLQTVLTNQIRDLNTAITRNDSTNPTVLSNISNTTQAQNKSQISSNRIPPKLTIIPSEKGNIKIIETSNKVIRTTVSQPNDVQSASPSDIIQPTESAMKLNLKNPLDSIQIPTVIPKFQITSTNKASTNDIQIIETQSINKPVESPPSQESVSESRNVPKELPPLSPEQLALQALQREQKILERLVARLELEEQKSRLATSQLRTQIIDQILTPPSTNLETIVAAVSQRELPPIGFSSGSQQPQDSLDIQSPPPVQVVNEKSEPVVSRVEQVPIDQQILHRKDITKTHQIQPPTEVKKKFIQPKSDIGNIHENIAPGPPSPFLDVPQNTNTDMSSSFIDVPPDFPSDMSYVDVPQNLGPINDSLQTQEVINTLDPLIAIDLSSPHTQEIITTTPNPIVQTTINIPFTDLQTKTNTPFKDTQTRTNTPFKDIQTRTNTPKKETQTNTITPIRDLQTTTSLPFIDIPNDLQTPQVIKVPAFQNADHIALAESAQIHMTSPPNIFPTEVPTLHNFERKQSSSHLQTNIGSNSETNTNIVTDFNTDTQWISNINNTEQNLNLQISNDIQTGDEPQNIALQLQKNIEILSKLNAPSEQSVSVESRQASENVGNIIDSFSQSSDLLEIPIPFAKLQTCVGNKPSLRTPKAQKSEDVPDAECSCFCVRAQHISGLTNDLRVDIQSHKTAGSNTGLNTLQSVPIVDMTNAKTPTDSIVASMNVQSLRSLIADVLNSFFKNHQIDPLAVAKEVSRNSTVALDYVGQAVAESSLMNQQRKQMFDNSGNATTTVPVTDVPIPTSAVQVDSSNGTVALQSNLTEIVNASSLSSTTTIPVVAVDITTTPTVPKVIEVLPTENVVPLVTTSVPQSSSSYVDIILDNVNASVSVMNISNPSTTAATPQSSSLPPSSVSVNTVNPLPLTSSTVVVNVTETATVKSPINNNGSIPSNNGAIDLPIPPDQASNVMTSNGNVDINIPSGNVAQLGNDANGPGSQSVFASTVDFTSSNNLGSPASTRVDILGQGVPSNPITTDLNPPFVQRSDIPLLAHIQNIPLDTVNSSPNNNVHQISGISLDHWNTQSDPMTSISSRLGGSLSQVNSNNIPINSNNVPMDPLDSTLYNNLFDMTQPIHQSSSQGVTFSSKKPEVIATNLSNSMSSAQPNIPVEPDPWSTQRSSITNLGTQPQGLLSSQGNIGNVARTSTVEPSTALTFAPSETQKFAPSTPNYELSTTPSLARPTTPNFASSTASNVLTPSTQMGSSTASNVLTPSTQMGSSTASNVLTPSTQMGSSTASNVLTPSTQMGSSNMKVSSTTTQTSSSTTTMDSLNEPPPFIFVVDDTPSSTSISTTLVRSPTLFTNIM